MLPAGLRPSRVRRGRHQKFPAAPLSSAACRGCFLPSLGCPMAGSSMRKPRRRHWPVYDVWLPAAACCHRGTARDLAPEGSALLLAGSADGRPPCWRQCGLGLPRLPATAPCRERLAASRLVGKDRTRRPVPECVFLFCSSRRSNLLGARRRRPGGSLWQEAFRRSLRPSRGASGSRTCSSRRGSLSSAAGRSQVKPSPRGRL
mmetsp:Transcript_29600/g.70527  ORF Transcript_29600/g.70527 Transcript_29600/m.70527 type:complete len:203 (-) Transcript_29600:839-1447(-)